MLKTQKEIFTLSEALCFFDLTNTHFEGQVLGNPKAKFGRSKQKRSDCRLLTLALIIDELGFVKYSRMYPGNQQETKTLAEMIVSLLGLHTDLAKNRTVIMDAGIATEDNLAYLRKEPLFTTIVVNRGKRRFQAADINIHDDDSVKRMNLKSRSNEKISTAKCCCFFLVQAESPWIRASAVGRGKELANLG